MKRTIPQSMPLLRERDVFAGVPLRGELMRRIAHAQNYIYSNAIRVYSNGGTEGNGNAINADSGTPNELGNPYWRENIPGGYSGVPFARFICPPNWGASQRLKIQGQATVGGTLRIVATVEDLNGSATGAMAETSVVVPGFPTLNSWSIELQMPGRLVQVTLWMVSEATSPTSAARIYWVSSRYREASAAELFGDAPQNWQYHQVVRTDKVASHSAPIHALHLRTLVRNTLSLWGDRPLEVYHAWIDRPYPLGAMGSVLAKHKYWVPYGLKTIGYYIQFEYLPSTGVTSLTLTIKRNGVTVATHAGIVASGVVSGTFTAGAAHSEDEFTVEFSLGGSSAGNDYDVIISGVSLWEDAYETSDIESDSIPLNYTPIDEDLLVADANVVYGKSGAGDLAHLLLNDTWLYKNRPRGIAGDWRRRLLKKVEADGAGFVPPYYDWTRGPSSIVYQNYPGRNITVRGDSGAHDDVDPLTKYQYGFAEAFTTAGTGGWLETGTWRRHGRRLCLTKCHVPTGLKTHRTHDYGKVSIWIRGCRRETATVPSTAYVDTLGTERLRGAEGPRVERANYRGRASFIIDYPKTSTETSRIDLKEFAFNGRIDRREGRLDIDREENPDAVQQWLGPAVQDHPAATGGDDDLLRIRGRCPERPGRPMRTAGVARAEGLMFEVELNQAFIADSPLGQDAIDSEPSPGELTLGA